MSNKTSFKRIALAVVVALGFGVLSTGPTQAVVNSDTLTVSASTGTQNIGGSDTITAATATVSFLTNSPADSMSLTVSLISSPATNAVLPQMQLIETTSAIVMPSIALGGADSATARFMVTATDQIGNGSVGIGTATLNTSSVGTGAWGSVVPSNTPVFIANRTRNSTAAVVSATFKVFMASPTVAGTYVVRVTPAITGNSGTTTMNAAARDITITVNATPCVRGCSAATAAASWASMFYTTALRGVDAASAANLTMFPGDSVINFTSALTNGTTSAQAANIFVYQQNTAGDIVYEHGTQANAATTNTNSGGVESMTATITGPGLLGAGSSSANPTGRNVIVTAGQYVTVWNDGTAGVATIKITGNTSGIVYATETVNFYGTATTVEVTASTTTVVNSGNLHYRYLSAVAKDANGIVNPVATNTLRLTSSDTNLMNVRMLAPDSSASTTFSATGAGRPGAYIAYWNLSTAADVTRLSTTRNGSFSLTVGTGGTTPVVGSLTSATTTIDSAAAVTIRLSNGIGGATLAFNKATYAPGEVAYLTLTATDSAGATAATATYATLLSAVEAAGFGSGIPATGSHALVSGAKTFTFTMPSVDTTAAVVVKGCTSATANNTTCTDWTASATAKVVDPATTAANSAAAALAAADAATDAANEAIDAANAATDAANIAAEAADAATVAAEEARDAADAATAAVEELATQVATLMAALSAQVKTLANTVAKIAKKVKA